MKSWSNDPQSECKLLQTMNLGTQIMGTTRSAHFVMVPLERNRLGFFGRRRMKKTLFWFLVNLTMDILQTVLWTFSLVSGHTIVSSTINVVSGCLFAFGNPKLVDSTSQKHFIPFSKMCHGFAHNGKPKYQQGISCASPACLHWSNSNGWVDWYHFEEEVMAASF